MIRDRSGALLVVLALGLASALGVLAFALSWSSTAGYGLSHLDAARVRLDAAQSTLGEAASLAIEGAIGDDAPPELRDMRDRLYDELIRALETARFGIPVTDHIVVEAEVPPARIAGLALPSGDVALEKLAFRLHGFRPVAYGDGSAFASPKVFYHESLFHDDSKDRMPRDFAGYLTVELTVAARERGRTARRTFRATRDAKVQDVTPPAREFGLFSYGVPPDKEYMLNDLNTGGRFTLYSKGARAFVRGPLFLKVEDAADPVHIGGDFRKAASVSYPERGRDWHGWAFIPGPRSVHMSNFTGDAREMMGRLAGLLGAEGVSARPRRPPATEDRATFDFLGLRAPGVALVGPALSPALGIFHPIPANEQIACANPWVYLTGVVPPGKQLFSLAGSPDGIGEVTPGTRTTIFDGLMSRKGGKVKEVYREGLRLPHETYATGQKVEDGDAVHPEPFGYETVEKTGKDKPLDQGIYGIYKIAEFKREPVLSAQVLDLLSNFWPPAKALVLGAETITRQMGMAPDIWIILVHWGTKAAKDLPERLDPEFLTTALEKKEYFIAPYGMYYESAQNRELMLEVATVLMSAGFSLTARRIEQAAMKKFFRQTPDDAPKMGDKAVATLKDKVFSQKLPKHADKAADMTHGALRWMAENFLFEELRNVVKSIVSSIFSNAIEGFAFVAAWRAIGYMRLRHLRAALGEIAKWEPPPSQADLEQEFPKGLYPPKYRPYQRVATRIYSTFHEMLERHTVDGVLELDEIVLVRSLSYQSATPVRYRGRGVIVALGGTAGTEPLLDCPVVRADPSSYLTLVVEDLAEDALVKSRAHTVALGPVFHGTVYSSSGARPAGERTLILGNLVTIHLRKSRIAADARLDVVYDADRLPPDRDKGGRKEWWRLSVSPRSAGLEE